jgi:hypothetical protein
MLWIYARGQESLRIETRFDNGTGEYVLIFYRDDGSQQIERFQDPDSFGSRLETLEQQLNTEAWRSEGPPMVLRDGWRI